MDVVDALQIGKIKQGPGTGDGECGEGQGAVRSRRGGGQ